jgi:hypothetical protein
LELIFSHTPVRNIEGCSEPEILWGGGLGPAKFCTGRLALLALSFFNTVSSFLFTGNLQVVLSTLEFNYASFAGYYSSLSFSANHSN